MTKKKITGPASATPKKKVWGSKQVLASPFAPSMPSANPETREKVLKVLLEVFPRPFAKRQPRPSRTENSQADEIPFKPAPCKKPPRILCGLNEVTRALERNIVELVIVSRDVTPALLVAHIPVLCFTSGAKLVIMSGDGTELGEVIGTRRMLVLGVRKALDDDESRSSGEAEKLVQSLSGLASPLEFPWLAAARSGKRVPAFPNPTMVPHRSKMDIG